jgi:hypothetical protein
VFEIVTLPASGETAVTGYRITIIAYKSGHETVAFSGMLKRKDAVAGTVRNDGTGGPTEVNFSSEKEESLFNQYVSLWTFGWSVDGSPQMKHNVETVVDTLAYEAMTVLARLNGKTTRQFLK